jgi:ABC-type transport system involved in cytochrome c biogenesis ATPase subunit
MSQAIVAVAQLWASGQKSWLDDDAKAEFLKDVDETFKLFMERK